MKPEDANARRIDFGPLFNLKCLHELMDGEGFDERQIRLANPDVLKDIHREGWSDGDVRQIIAVLVAKDYKKSEWARIDRGRRWVACDVYHTYYDALRRRRDVRAVPVYLKFSVDMGGSSDHPDRVLSLLNLRSLG